MTSVNRSRRGLNLGRLPIPTDDVNLADRLQAGAESGLPQPTLASPPSKTNARC
jgi:hypothetical protein